MLMRQRDSGDDSGPLSPANGLFGPALTERSRKNRGVRDEDELDGTVYCSRQDRIISVERCYACEYGVVVRRRVACAYDDLTPRLRLTEALQRSLRRLRPSTT
jgi:hypothetical protein